MKLQYKWIRRKAGLYHYVQIWRTLPIQQRIVAIVDRGVGGYWYTTLQQIHPCYDTHVERFKNSKLAKTHIEKSAYPKMPTIERD